MKASTHPILLCLLGILFLLGHDNHGTAAGVDLALTTKAALPPTTVTAGIADAPTLSRLASGRDLDLSGNSGTDQASSFSGSSDNASPAIPSTLTATLVPELPSSTLSPSINASASTQLVNFTVDADLGMLWLTFSHPIQYKTVDLALIFLTNGTSSVSLDQLDGTKIVEPDLSVSAASSFSKSSVLVLVLGTQLRAHLELANDVLHSPPTTLLHLDSGAVTDLRGHAIMAIPMTSAVPPASFAADASFPYIISARLESPKDGRIPEGMRLVLRVSELVVVSERFTPEEMQPLLTLLSDNASTLAAAVDDSNTSTYGTIVATTSTGVHLSPLQATPSSTVIFDVALPFCQQVAAHLRNHTVLPRVAFQLGGWAIHDPLGNIIMPSLLFSAIPLSLHQSFDLQGPSLVAGGLNLGTRKLTLVFQDDIGFHSQFATPDPVALSVAASPISVISSLHSITLSIYRATHNRKDMVLRGMDVAAQRQVNATAIELTWILSPSERVLLHAAQDLSQSAVFVEVPAGMAQDWLNNPSTKAYLQLSVVPDHDPPHMTLCDLHLGLGNMTLAFQEPITLDTTFPLQLLFRGDEGSSQPMSAKTGDADITLGSLTTSTLTVHPVNLSIVNGELAWDGTPNVLFGNLVTAQLNTDDLQLVRHLAVQFLTRPVKVMLVKGAILDSNGNRAMTLSELRSTVNMTTNHSSVNTAHMAAPVMFEADAVPPVLQRATFLLEPNSSSASPYEQATNTTGQQGSAFPNVAGIVLEFDERIDPLHTRVDEVIVSGTGWAKTFQVTAVGLRSPTRLYLLAPAMQHFLEDILPHNAETVIVTLSGKLPQAVDIFGNAFLLSPVRIPVPERPPVGPALLFAEFDDTILQTLACRLRITATLPLNMSVLAPDALCITLSLVNASHAQYCGTAVSQETTTSGHVLLLVDFPRSVADVLVLENVRLDQLFVEVVAPLPALAGGLGPVLAGTRVRITLPRPLNGSHAEASPLLVNYNYTLPSDSSRLATLTLRFTRPIRLASVQPQFFTLQNQGKSSISQVAAASFDWTLATVPPEQQHYRQGVRPFYAYDLSHATVSLETPWVLVLALSLRDQQVLAAIDGFASSAEDTFLSMKSGAVSGILGAPSIEIEEADAQAPLIVRGENLFEPLTDNGDDKPWSLSMILIVIAALLIPLALYIGLTCWYFRRRQNSHDFELERQLQKKDAASMQLSWDEFSHPILPPDSSGWWKGIGQRLDTGISLDDISQAQQQVVLRDTDKTFLASTSREPNEGQIPAPPHPHVESMADEAKVLHQTTLSGALDIAKHVGETVIAIWDFEATYMDEVSFKADESLTVLGTSDLEPEWVQVRSMATGKSGLAPRSYLCFPHAYFQARPCRKPTLSRMSSMESCPPVQSKLPSRPISRHKEEGKHRPPPSPESVEELPPWRSRQGSVNVTPAVSRATPTNVSPPSYFTLLRSEPNRGRTHPLPVSDPPTYSASECTLITEQPVGDNNHVHLASPSITSRVTSSSITPRMSATGFSHVSHQSVESLRAADAIQQAHAHLQSGRSTPRFAASHVGLNAVMGEDSDLYHYVMESSAI
eukprot:m.115894 g.115894  ORF g.115894 m.115894 type:complete len:1574 (-) comp15380_c1_seq1:285-5006(-)